MNTENILLSSNAIPYSEILPEVSFEDYTTLYVTLSNLLSAVIPRSVDIDWGDGETEYHDSTVYKRYAEDEITFEYVPSVFYDTYSHEYSPSTTTLFKSLTAQFLVNYVNDDIAWFVMPISINTNGFFREYGNVKLLGSKISTLSSNGAEHQILSENGGLFEITT